MSKKKFRLNNSKETLENEAQGNEGEDEDDIKTEINDNQDDVENDSYEKDEDFESVNVENLVTDDIKDEDIVKEENTQDASLPQITINSTPQSKIAAAHHFKSARKTKKFLSANPSMMFSASKFNILKRKSIPCKTYSLKRKLKARLNHSKLENPIAKLEPATNIMITNQNDDR